MKKPAVLLIYTGGTIGMVQDARTGQLTPFNFGNLYAQIPELARLEVDISAESFATPVDSSAMEPAHWVQLCDIIMSNYEHFDGFVILHGTDTMAFTASALSFMLQGLTKPVILTGSQLPIGVIRTDGKENLITAIEVCALQENGRSVVREVCVYFEYRLMRGNRVTKFSAEQFDAFRSANYPALCEAGVHLQVNRQALLSPQPGMLKLFRNLCTDVAVLHIFPGMPRHYVSSVLSNDKLRGVVLRTFGSGNAPIAPWFIEQVEQSIRRGVLVCNVTQCATGRVEQGRYQTSAELLRIGVASGSDMTLESALTKLMVLLGDGESVVTAKRLFESELCGELTPG